VAFGQSDHAGTEAADFAAQTMGKAAEIWNQSAEEL
jgi:hypothetical protein